jgi:hypothetical protein
MLDGPYNRGQNGATGAATDQLPDHGADVSSATRSPLEGWNEQLQELPAAQPTEGAGNGVAGRAEAEVLQA